MKKKKRILVLLIFILLFLNMGVYASTDDDVFGNASDELNTTEESRAEKYSLDRYTFDSDDWGMLDVWAYPVMGLVNALFVIQALLAKLGSLLLQFAFNFYIFDMVADLFDTIMISLGNAIFYPYLKIIFGVIGITALVYIGVGRVASGLKLILNTLMILVVVYLFLQSPSTVMRMVNNISDEISGELIKSTSSVVNPQIATSDDAIVTMSNTFWEITVEKPWSMIETGQMLTQAEMDSILSHDVGSDARNAAIQPFVAKGYFTPVGQLKRLGTGIMMFLLCICQILGVTLVAGLAVMYQFASLLSSFIIIIAALVALLPNQGFRVLTNSFYTVFSFLSKKLGNVLLLSIYFVISSAFYDSLGAYGWGVTMLLQIMLLGTMVVFRGKILGFADTLQKGGNATIGNMKQKANPYQKVTGAYASLRMAGMAKKKMSAVRKNGRVNKNKKLAGKYLDRRYSDEKRQAEQVAHQKGHSSGKNVKPEYSDFVKKANSRVANGYDAHSEQDIHKTASYMAQLKESGDDPRNLLMVDPGQHSEATLGHAQLDMEHNVEKDRGTLSGRLASNRLKMNRIIKGTEGSMHRKMLGTSGVGTRLPSKLKPKSEIKTIHTPTTEEQSIPLDKKKVVNGTNIPNSDTTVKNSEKVRPINSNVTDGKDISEKVRPINSNVTDGKDISEKVRPINSNVTNGNEIKEVSGQVVNLDTIKTSVTEENKVVAQTKKVTTVEDSKTVNEKIENNENVNVVTSSTGIINKTETNVTTGNEETKNIENTTVTNNEKTSNEVTNNSENIIVTNNENSKTVSVEEKTTVKEVIENINKTNQEVTNKTVTNKKDINVDEYQVMNNNGGISSGGESIILNQMQNQARSTKKLEENLEGMKELYTRSKPPKK